MNLQQQERTGEEGQEQMVTIPAPSLLLSVDHDLE
jgi:hypothetical protein